MQGNSLDAPVMRAFGAADAGALGDLMVELGADSEARHFHPHPMTHEEAERLATGWPGRKDQYFGVFVDGVLAGYAMLRGWDEGYAIPAFGVAVAARYRGLGLGRALLRHAIALATELHAPAIMLHVHTGNPGARRLYESEGFTFEAEPDARGQVKGLRTLP